MCAGVSKSPTVFQVVVFDDGLRVLNDLRTVDLGAGREGRVRGEGGGVRGEGEGERGGVRGEGMRKAGSIFELMLRLQQQIP